MTTSAFTHSHTYTQKQLLALCPKHPNSSTLPLPGSVQELYSDIFIQSVSENISNSYNITEHHDSTLLKPILLLKLSERDRELLKHPIVSGNIGPKKHQSGSSHFRQNPSFYDTKGQHHPSGKGRGGSFPRRNLVPFDLSNEDHHELENFRRKPDHQNVTRQRQRQRRNEDHPILYDNIDEEQEDPWADPTETPGKFDEHGNFVPFDTQERPKEESESIQKAKQSRFASLLSEREEKQHTLLQTAPPMTIPDDWIPLPFFHAWTYCDPSAKIQGPFIAQQMYEWTRIGYFTPSLLVKPDLSQIPEKDYKLVLSTDLTNSYNPLSKWIEKYRCYPWSSEAKSSKGPKLEQASSKANNAIDKSLPDDSAIITMKKEKTQFPGWQVPKMDIKTLSEIQNERQSKNERSFEPSNYESADQSMEKTKMKNGIDKGAETRSNTSWSSIAASHKQINTNMTAKNTNVKTMAKTEPSVEEKNIVNDTNDPLVQWVTEELERCKIKDLDIPTFVGCIRDLSERDLEDVVPVYISSKDADRFIQKFVKSREAVIGKSTDDGKHLVDIKEDDGFSLVSRSKPRKTKQYAPSNTKKTVVGLAL